VNLDIGRENDVTVIAVAGELVVDTRGRLREAVTDRIAAGDRKFIVDFDGTSYIDSSGLGLLVSLATVVRDEGGELRLAGLGDDLRTLFELTRLDTLFHIADDRGQALADF
jgi:anti-sigma B factor antagonist